MSKRTRLRKRSEPRSIKPTLFWGAAMVVAIALTVLCITVYVHTGSSTATEDSRPNPATSTGPFYLIVILVAGCLLALAMLTLEIRQYLRKGRARRK